MSRVHSRGGLGGGGTIQSLVAGSGITIDDTDPRNPIVINTGAGGPVAALDNGSSVLAGVAGFDFVGSAATVGVSDGGGGIARVNVQAFSNAQVNGSPISPSQVFDTINFAGALNTYDQGGGVLHVEAYYPPPPAIAIYNNGSSYGYQSGINFTGGCAVSNSGYGVDVYVTPGPQGDPGPQGNPGDPGPPGPINTVYWNGSSYGSPSGLNFTGNVSVNYSGYGVDIAINGDGNDHVDAFWNGSFVANGALDFRGSLNNVYWDGSRVVVDIAGGGGGSDNKVDAYWNGGYIANGPLNFTGALNNVYWNGSQIVVDIASGATGPQGPPGNDGAPGSPGANGTNTIGMYVNGSDTGAHYAIGISGSGVQDGGDFGTGYGGNGRQYNLVDASSSQSGFLTNSDWSTFNGKMDSLAVEQTGTVIGSRRTLNFATGTIVTDDGVNDRITLDFDPTTAAYTPGNSGHWSGDPTTIQQAIDRIAAVVSLGGASPIP